MAIPPGRISAPIPGSYSSGPPGSPPGSPPGWVSGPPGSPPGSPPGWVSGPPGSPPGSPPGWVSGPPGSPPGCVSYTVLFLPLRTPLHSLEGLSFYFWIKRLKDLEREKDSLWCGADVLEQARFWYLSRLEENRSQQENTGNHAAARTRNPWGTQAGSCLLRSRIQRANGSLGSVMSEPNVTGSTNCSSLDAWSDSDLRWRNTALAQEVSEKNREIMTLELEKELLLQQLGELRVY